MYTTLPPTGMRDFLPREKEMREYVMKEIKNEYKKSEIIFYNQQNL